MEPVGMMMMMMPMYFWRGNEMTWLFYGVDSTTAGQYAGGLIVVLLMGIVLEGITYLRNYIYVKEQAKAIKKTEELNK
jgi:hypothetical protein